MKEKIIKLISFMTALLLAATMILVSPKTEIFAVDETFIDDCADFTKVATKSTGFEIFPDHWETHQSVIAKTVATPQYLTYSAAGKKITGFTLSIQIYKGFYVLDRDLEVSVRVYGSQIFQVISTVAGSETAIPGIATFANVAVIPASILTDNIEEIKLTLKNDIAYTQMVNQVVLTYASTAPAATPTLTPTITPTNTPTNTPAATPTAIPTTTLTATPTITVTPPAGETFIDDCVDFNKVATRSSSLEVFPNHAETHQSVIAKSSGTPQYMTYSAIGKKITNFELSIQYFGSYVATDLEVSVRPYGSQTFQVVTIGVGIQTAIAGTNFFNLPIMPASLLADNVQEIKITLLNGINYTQMVNQVVLTYAPTVPLLSSVDFGYEITQGTYVVGVPAKYTAVAFLSNCIIAQNMTVQLYDKSDILLGVQDYVTTGTRIKVNNTVEIIEYTIVVNGDTDGDGIIAISDLAKQKFHLLNILLLEMLPVTLRLL